MKKHQEYTTADVDELYSLSKRAKTVLNNYGITTAPILYTYFMEFKRRGFMSMYGCGKKTAKEIVDFIRPYKEYMLNEYSIAVDKNGIVIFHTEYYGKKELNKNYKQLKTTVNVRWY